LLLLRDGDRAVPRGRGPDTVLMCVDCQAVRSSSVSAGVPMTRAEMPDHQRVWSIEDGSARQVVEVVAEELGPSLRWATARPERTSRTTS
jgi:hypothetical protein